MIHPEIRRAVVANFPALARLVILAPPAAGYAAIVAARADVAVDVRTPDNVRAGDDTPWPFANVLLEGIDDLEDPVTFFERLRERTPRARLFALIANAAHLPGLGRFYAGAPSPARPLVREEIAPLFRAGGWEPASIASIVDASLPAPGSVPIEFDAGPIKFQIVDPEMLERGRCAAFFVTADRR